MSSANVYLILGPAGAGRRAVLADLISNGLDATARPVLLTAASEAAPAAEVETRLAAIPSLTRGNWQLENGVLSAAVPAAVTHVFLLSDGRANPVDQVEAFQLWLAASGAELARVITVVNCQLALAHPILLRWYDACVHFSDVVLLSRRDGVPNKWVTDFIARYRKQHYPCLIEMVKRTDFPNPALLLEPEARRMSQLFDETDAVTVAVITDDDEDDEADASDEETVDEDAVPIDPYIERLSGSGRRAKEIPDIAKFLKEQGEMPT